MNTKVAAVLGLVVLLLVLAIQNTAVVDVRLLFWTVSMSRALLILFSAVLGYVAGISLPGWRIRSH
jgi:uncharacterized integral membrane protein